MTATPKPSPPRHVVALPPARPEGLNNSAAEGRRRIVQMLLPHITDVDDLLTVADWIEHGTDDEDEDG